MLTRLWWNDLTDRQQHLIIYAELYADADTVNDAARDHLALIAALTRKLDDIEQRRPPDPSTTPATQAPA